MTNQLHGKVRFVKCPKCANILQEPEQVPLYACGGCDTVLQAKYYRGDSSPTRSHSLEQSIVQSYNDGLSADGGESSSSSRRSNSSAEQSIDQNGWSDKNADESCKQEQLRTSNTAHHALLSEESSFLDNHENGVIENDADHDRRDNEVIHNQEQLEAENSAFETSFSKGVTSLENKDSEQLDSVNPIREDDNEQDSKQTECADSSKDTSTLNESQVIENKESLSYAPDQTVLGNTESPDSVLTGAIENEDDQQQQSSDIAFDNQKQVKEVNHVREASVLSEHLAIENNDQLQLASELSDRNSLEDTRKENLDGEGTKGIILIDEIHRLDLETPPTVAKLADEDDNGNTLNEFVECTKEQLGKMNLGEASSSAEITQVVNVVSLEEIQFNSEALRATREVGSFTVFQQTQSQRSLVDKLPETSTRKVENFDNSAVYGPVNTHKEVGSSFKAVPRSLTKGSLAYDGSISSLDGNDDQALEQEEHITEETLPGNGTVLGYVGSEESPEWSNNPSRKSYNSSNIQNQPKNYSQLMLDGKMKSTMLEEEESVNDNVILERNRIRQNRERFPPKVPFHRSSELAYETGSSFSSMHDEIPVHSMHRPHPYRYEDQEPWVRKMYAPKGNMDRRRIPEASWREKEFLSTYYNYETSGEFHNGSRYHHNHMEGRRQGENWSQSGNIPPMPYSGEVPNRRYQMRDPYMHRHHDDDFWWSAQSGPQIPSGPQVPSVYRQQGPYAAPSREISWDSCYSIPPRFMEYGPYPWSHDPVAFSDDQRHKDQAMRRLYMREKRQTLKKYFQPMAGGAPFVACNFCFSVLQLPEDFLLSRSSKTYRIRCGDCSKILEFTLENESCLAPHKPNVNAVKSEFQHADEKSKAEPRNSGNVEQNEGSPNVAGSSDQSRETKVSWQLSDRKSPLHRLMGYSSPNVLLNGHESEDDA